MVLTSDGKKGRIHCIKGSELWSMFEKQNEDVVVKWNKSIEQYPSLSKRVFPEMIEL